MKNLLEENNFIGSVFFSAEDQIAHGKIEESDALVAFGGSSITEVKVAFQKAAEDYIVKRVSDGKQANLILPETPHFAVTSLTGQQMK